MSGGELFGAENERLRGEVADHAGSSLNDGRCDAGSADGDSAQATDNEREQGLQEKLRHGMLLGVERMGVR